jgi:hopanoid biosynthesis associated RND transporter like protein HpnN
MTSITLLPALITLLNPPSEGREVGYKFLAPLDEFLTRHRWWVIGVTVGLALLGSPLLMKVRFDFNPLNLNSPKVESVATLLDLSKSPDTTPNKIDVLETTLAGAREMAVRLAKVPQVGEVKTLLDFIPPDQDPKLTLIKDAADLLGPSLSPDDKPPPQSDQDDVTAMNSAVVRLEHAAAKAPDQKGEGVAVTHRLADAIRKLAAAPPEARKIAAEAFVPPMQILVSDIADLLSAEKVALDTLPEDLKRDWVTPDGRARIEVTPKNLDGSNATLAAFSRAVLAVAPEATGQPVVIQDSGRSVIWAFIEAGLLAFGSIAILLYVVLRKIVDVLLTLVPLLLAGVLTMEITVLIDLPLNFANIIALPLLLGLGVAFKIYFVMAWRAGQTHLLQSSLTRAVFFSAMATAVAFGSLWSSNHPGTSSMGKLLALSLACTLVAAVFFQPALMGPPRAKRTSPTKAPQPSSRQLINEAAE